MRILLAVGMLFSGSLAIAAESTLEARLTRAEALSAKGEDAKALREARAVLADAENDPAAGAPEIGAILSRLARIYLSAGAVAEYGEISDRLSAVEPKDYGVWVSLGELRRQQGLAHQKEAEAALRKALSLRPGDARAKWDLIYLYEQSGRLEDEIPFLKSLIEKSPGDHALYVQLANTYMRLDRPAEAKETFARAKENGELTADDYIEQGYFSLDSGESRRAEDDFERAVAIDTANPLGYLHLGAYFAESKRYPEAESNLRRALELLEADPKSTPGDLMHAARRLAQAIEAQGRSAEAEAVLRKSLARPRPQRVHPLRLLRSLGALCESHGRVAQAEAAYRQAVDECRVRFSCEPAGAVRALIDLGEFELRRGRRAEAEALAERAEAAVADVPAGLELPPLGDLALFRAKLGDWKRSEELYARLASHRDPFDPLLVPPAASLAEMEGAQGRFHEAEIRYREAVGILDHNGRRKDAAGLLDRLAALEERGGARAAAADDRKKAEALRGGPGR